jgi:hypothetical protein
MDLWHDAYNELGAAGWDQGQPIMTAPILSVDNLGNTTVNYSTGDQDTFVQTVGMKNYVWSVIEDATSTPQAYKSKTPWRLEFDNGTRVTGPLSLFSSVLYFATFIPDPTATAHCGNGHSDLWGVDYIHPKDPADPRQGPLPGLQNPADPNDPTDKVNSQSIGDNTIVFGVGVTQTPSCDDESTGNLDQYLGMGNHTSISNVSSGKFQLVVQTGAGGSQLGGAQANGLQINLPTPASAARVDSWAAILEPY